MTTAEKNEIATNLRFALADSIRSRSHPLDTKIYVTEDLVNKIIGWMNRMADDRKTCPKCQKRELQAEEVARNYAKENTELRVKIKELSPSQDE